MKRLTITYNGVVLYDADVVSMSWSEDDGAITVTGRDKPGPPRPQQGLTEILGKFATAARKQQGRKTTDNGAVDVVTED